ncbi:MAG: hypothetical protein LC679_15900 [Intrasporangiaceae bacterium]|nr:hypothetical protein [Intrasporangiaceae bacterium]
MKQQKTSRRVPSERLAEDLATEGGFTVQEETGIRPDQGIAVADFGAERIVRDPGADAGDIERYRQDFADNLAGPRKFLGGWRDPQTEADYLDTSEVVGTRREAFHVGQRNAQRAVMDLGTFEEHSVPYSPGLPGPKRTGQTPQEFHKSEAQNRELGRSMIEHQLHGRADPSQAAERGDEIAKAMIARDNLHAEVRGMHPRAQVKRGKS